MLYLQFYLDQQRYVMDTDSVITLIPVVNIQEIPNTPKHVLGVINYKGKSIPVVDVVELICGRPANLYLSTRIVLVRIILKNKAVKLLGLMIEKVTEIVKLDEVSFTNNQVAEKEAPYINAALADEKGIIHRIKSDFLLSGEDQQLLFSA